MSEQEPIEVVDLRNEVTRLQEMLVERDCEVETLASEIELRRAEAMAIDAWRDAQCAGIWVSVGSMDHGGYGCDDDSDSDRNGCHHPDCPVEAARVAFFAATQRRRELERAARPDLERSASEAVGESAGDK